MRADVQAMYAAMGRAFAGVWAEIGILTLADGRQIRLHMIYRPGRQVFSVDGDSEYSWSAPTISFRRDQLIFAGLRDLEGELVGATFVKDGKALGLDDIRDDETAMVSAKVADRASTERIHISRSPLTS
ncbi:hypothetical protein D3P06_17550 [Paracoccus aestuarii]|uniref:Uncharacterized protein n=1 Tax=Paracoccus aestuarii TaxID=453842 RepID=A0A418ZQ95_9RHOB|nr:hypothetical protein [Paracoccus aestuarii]RJK96614.1 hypothetical protein D3P06_17550 [Paracoccus aestuarii]WCR00095.1 hypothetical protein JHW48_05165 [Paracoccus aestuarii]